MIINPATGVLGRYYHRYARWLATRGFAVVTYDYSGIGLSRAGPVRGSRITWRDWGERDFEAVLRWAQALPKPLAVIGHSIGGVLIGFAEGAPALDRILTVGAQYAYWPDYAARRRLELFLRWNVAMPAVAAACGYFPGRRLGWLEDLPKPIAYEWAFRRAQLEKSYPEAARPGIVARFAAVRAPILALSMTDDDFGTEAALRRALAYFTGAKRHVAMVPPSTIGETAVGHFAPFHDRLRDSLWPITLAWLRDGTMPIKAAAVPLPRVSAK